MELGSCSAASLQQSCGASVSDRLQPDACRHCGFVSQAGGIEEPGFKGSMSSSASAVVPRPGYARSEHLVRAFAKVASAKYAHQHIRFAAGGVLERAVGLAHGR